MECINDHTAGQTIGLLNDVDGSADGGYRGPWHELQAGCQTVCPAQRNEFGVRVREPSTVGVIATHT